MRTFDEINTTYSVITGVPITQTLVAGTYATVKQQLPTVEAIDAFLASHQTGIAQLAISYCSAMVDNDTLRTAFFPGLGMTSTTPGSFFSTQGNRDAVISALQTKAVGINLTSQPTNGELSTELNNLFTSIAGGSNAATAGRAFVATKAACAAVLGSAVSLVQ
jgi:hypothetical protein